MNRDQDKKQHGQAGQQQQGNPSQRPGQDQQGGGTKNPGQQQQQNPNPARRDDEEDDRTPGGQNK
ncbi:hypothetical protein G5V57_01825 [Nordella sp. HKS 07]|uniref:hypothetical protein n=1 Tax=Nordella sp. HKS 07 TaxID=2712222 RepID=UPI0013E1677E|nr:hypothetical protein [Nordella sp. HKS 07]QIG46606.1 hypothetical protein G5V57_01825 [Nordella sp. HKS 07]